VPEAVLLARLSAMGDPVAEELLRLRRSIDNMDAALVHLLAERFKVTQRVGELKAAHGLPPADPVREAQQIERLRALAEDARLDPEFAEKFLNFVVAEVVRHHKAARDQNAASGQAYVTHHDGANEHPSRP
jgi:chorismate mutase